MSDATRNAELDKAAAILARLGFRPVAWQHEDGMWIGDHMAEGFPLSFLVMGERLDSEEVVVDTAADIPEAVRRVRAAGRAKGVR